MSECHLIIIIHNKMQIFSFTSYKHLNKIQNFLIFFVRKSKM